MSSRNTDPEVWKAVEAERAKEQQVLRKRRADEKDFKTNSNAMAIAFKKAGMK